RLKDMVLVNNSRLSVQPVSEAEWAVVMELTGMDKAKP
ncbi:MAG: EVE domain-containing protein, partial [Paracoccus sp. (in: a-proteobacteria)]